MNSIGFIHGTVCHKYEFINKETRVNTQAIESFNNYLKYYIKMKKGIEPQRREHFLIEFVWKFNSKENLVSNLFDLIKIKYFFNLFSHILFIFYPVFLTAKKLTVFFKPN
ncbi:hypothetical protein H311_00096 [Anncaliia algerae PRA109]|nr:hypothetical protein H311_00096 [Anncaliia algerae PRA109]